MLRFSHQSHLKYADSAARQCATCHSPGRASMNVSLPEPATCLACHAHAAPAHLADDNKCATCHVALTAARDVPAWRITAFPLPPSHERASFRTQHAVTVETAGANCATCHARESCARCHVNASTVPQIAVLGHDARVASLVAGKTFAYPEPADHKESAFAVTHGALAERNRTRCGACHARSSCETCHTGENTGRVLRGIPEAEAGGARGVELIHQGTRRRLNPPPSLLSMLPALFSDTVASPQHTAPRTVRVHDIGFRTGHRAQAAAGALTCSGCHAQRFCTDCHSGENRRRFHPANFEARHAPDSYGREAECASCHNTEAFCRSCHQSSGLAAQGRLDVAFHTAQPLWLLKHGQAARQGLASCTTCHKQSDCQTCHSTTGWGISPHGRNFNSSRMAKSAAPMCFRCHVTLPATSRQR